MFDRTSWSCRIQRSRSTTDGCNVVSVSDPGQSASPSPVAHGAGCTRRISRADIPWCKTAFPQYFRKAVRTPFVRICRRLSSLCNLYPYFRELCMLIQDPQGCPKKSCPKLVWEIRVHSFPANLRMRGELCASPLVPSWKCFGISHQVSASKTTIVSN